MQVKEQAETTLTPKTEKTPISLAAMLALPRGEYTIGPQQDNQTSSGKTLYASMRLTDNPSNNMDGRDSNSFLIHGGELSTGCVVADRATRDAVAISGTNTLEVER